MCQRKDIKAYEDKAQQALLTYLEKDLRPWG